MYRFVFSIALLTLLLVGCDSSPRSPASASAPKDQSIPSADTTAPDTEPRTLEWDDLMPADFDPGAPFKDIDIAPA